MLESVISSFVGAFAAIVVLAEVAIANKWVKYLVALLVGALVAIILALILSWMVAMLSRAT